MLKKVVLRGKHVFNDIYRSGKATGDRYVVVFHKKNCLPYNGTAFLASKKVGNSVTRNRATRLMKESYRQFKDSFKDGYDIIFIARNTICDKKCIDVLKSMKSAAKRSGILKK